MSNISDYLNCKKLSIAILYILFEMAFDIHFYMWYFTAVKGKEENIMYPKIDKKDLEIWADYLLNHSLGGINHDDIVMVKGEYVT